MKNSNIESLPLEFIKLNALLKKKKENVKKKIPVNVSFYQSKNVIQETFYKPISKIINFEI